MSTVSECDGKQGVCPDERVGGRNDVQVCTYCKAVRFFFFINFIKIKIWPNSDGLLKERGNKHKIPPTTSDKRTGERSSFSYWPWSVCHCSNWTVEYASRSQRPFSFKLWLQQGGHSNQFFFTSKNASLSHSHSSNHITMSPRRMTSPVQHLYSMSKRINRYGRHANYSARQWSPLALDRWVELEASHRMPTIRRWVWLGTWTICLCLYCLSNVDKRMYLVWKAAMQESKIIHFT